MGKKSHKIPNRFFKQLHYVVRAWLGYMTVLSYIFVWVYCAPRTGLSQCCSTAELCTGSAETGVPGQGQFFCPVWVLLYSIFWQCRQRILGGSREHLQLSSKACSRFNCRHLTAAKLNRQDQAGWRETRDHLWMQMNEWSTKPLRDRGPQWMGRKINLKKLGDSKSM